MSLTVAFWNIKQNNPSSTLYKQTKVNHFIDTCIDINIPVIFLCEIHSNQVNDYVNYLSNIFREYYITSFTGGYNSDYIVLTHKDLNVEILHNPLKVLKGNAVFMQVKGLSLLFSHFKSGNAVLTKNQLINAATFLQEITPGKWACIGDMNWDYKKLNSVSSSFTAYGHTCWEKETHKDGKILDWCLAGDLTKVTPFNLISLFPEEIYDMNGPDCKPIVFALET